MDRQPNDGAYSSPEAPNGLVPMSATSSPEPYSGAISMSQSAVNPQTGQLNPYVPVTHQSMAPQTVPNILRLRGLPYTSEEKDVRDFFQGFEIDDPDGVVVITQGLHRGEAFVRFKSEQIANEAAVARHKQNMGTRFIEVLSALQGAMEAAQATQRAAESGANGHIVRLRGLPYQATPADIYAFFASLSQYIVDVRICAGFDGRSTGDAFVEFANHTAAHQALQKNREPMGNRYIEVFDSSTNEREVLLARPRKPGGRGRQQSPYSGMPPPHYPTHHRGGMFTSMPQYAASPGFVNGSMGRGGMPGVFSPYHSMPPQMIAVPPHARRPISDFVVRLRGLPFSCTEAIVAQFFTGVNICPQGVHMVYNAQDRPTGEAFVEVRTQQDLESALRMHQQTLGHRYVEVFPSSAGDLARFGGIDQFSGHPTVPVMPPVMSYGPSPVSIVNTAPGGIAAPPMAPQQMAAQPQMPQQQMQSAPYPYPMPHIPVQVQHAIAQPVPQWSVDATAQPAA